MTNQWINDAIGRAIGLVAVCDLESGLWHLRQCGTRNIFGFNCGLDEDHAWRVCCPDYCTDLNAMHEAEKSLSASSCAEYRSNLMDVVKESCLSTSKHFNFEDGIQSRFYFHATAGQRAEAFLRTIGKWKEESK